MLYQRQCYGNLYILVERFQQDHLLQVIGAWGATGVPEDLDGDGVVGVGDLLAVIAAWGMCP